MNTADNGGLGFKAKIDLNNLRKDAEQLKKELRLASVSGTDSMDKLSKGAADAIRAMASRVKSDIKDTEREINTLSKKIIQQSSLIKDVEMDVAKRKAVYNRSFGIDKTEALKEWQASKRALDEEKAALTGLTTERSVAKIKLTELKQEHREYNEVIKQGNKLKGTMVGLLTKIGGVYALKRLGQEIIDVRGEMQMLNISFATLLGNKEKADKLMGQLTTTVLETPLQLTELAQGAKQLLAFGFAAENVNGTLLRLGNVAKGLSIPLSDMVYLFGTTMTEGRLFARDLRQFTTRGIPLADELAKQFGITKEKVSELVSAGKVGFPQVEKAIVSMTSEGGRFYNLMQEQAKSIPGQLSNLADSLTMQFNKIGSSMEGVISGGISGTKFLVDNLDVLGRTLISLVATYGIYRTAVMAVTAAQGAYGLKTLVFRNYLLAAQKAQAFLNATMLANPYVAAAVALSTLIGLMWAFSDSTTAAEKAQQSLNKTLAEIKAKKEEMVSDVQKLIGTIKNETSSVYEQIKAYDELIKRYAFFAKYSREDIKNMTEADINSLVASFGQQTEKNTAQSLYDNKLKELQSLQARLDETVQQQAVSPSGQKSSLILSLQEDIKRAKEEAEGLKKNLEEVVRLEKESNIASMTKDEQKNYYKVEIEKLTKAKEQLTGEINSFARDAISTEIQALQTKLDDVRKTQVVKNKSYWEKVKKDAEEILDEIDREKFRKLESGITTGVDPETVAIYKENSALRDKAESMLSTKKKDEGEKQLKVQQALNDRVLASQSALEKAKVEIMAQGREKELEEIRLSTRMKVEEINKEEQALAKAYKDAKQTMPADQRAEFEARRGMAVQAGQQAEQGVNVKYYDELKAREKQLSQVFLSENEKRKQSVRDRYDAERKWANEMFGKGGMTQEQYNSFVNLIDSAETEEALSSFREKYKSVADQITEIEKQAAADRLLANTDAQRAMIDEWEKAQKSRILSQNLLGDDSFGTLLGNLGRTGTGKIQGALSTAKGKLKSAMDSGDLTPTDFKTLTDAIERAEGVVRERNPFKALTTAVKEYKKQPKGEKDLTDIASAAAEGFALVQGSLSAVTDGLKKMGLAGDEESQELMGAFVELAGSASELAEGIATKNPVMIIKGTIGVVTSMFEIFDKRSRNAQREIRRQQEAIKELEKAYRSLEQQIKTAFSTDYYRKQIEQARNLEIQVQRTYAMIAAEESKRRRKRDKEKIEQWKNDIEELKNQAADIRRAVVEELMTTDLRSFSSQLASSVIQGYVEGMDDMDSVVQDSMDELMRNMVAKQFDTLVAQQLLKPMFAEMEKAINAEKGDFVFDSNEMQNIKAAGEVAKNSLLTAGEGYRKMLEELGLISDEQSREGAKKGIAQASQESIDELTGTMTNIQSHTYSISNDFKSLLNSANMIVKHMMNIDTNTKRLEGIERDMGSVKQGVDEINQRGIKVR